jgi:hypothetical protein
LTAADEVAAADSKRLMGAGFVADRATREELLLAAEKDALRSYFLVVEGRPWAFLIGKRRLDTLYARFAGYNPEFAKYSPGLHLFLRCVEDLYRSKGSVGIWKYDFGPGNQPYNRAMANWETEEATVQLYAPRVRAFGIKLIRTSVIFARLMARKIAKRDIFHDRIFKSWRTLLLWIASR